MHWVLCVFDYQREPSFRDREFDRNLICDVMDRLRLLMPGLCTWSI